MSKFDNNKSELLFASEELFINFKYLLKCLNIIRPTPMTAHYKALTSNLKKRYL